MSNGVDLADLDLSVVPVYVWLILLIVGLILCFFGEIIWEFMVSILGAIIGSMIGYGLGYVLGGFICAFGLMFVFAIIGSMLFRYLAKAAVALLCALLAFGGVAYLSYISGLTLTTSLIIGLIVGIIIFIIAIMFVEEIISVFLAAIGGFLVGVAVYFLVGGDFALVYAGLAGGSMFILGAIFQVMMQRQRKGPRRGPPRREPVRETKPRTTAKEPQAPAQEPKPPTQRQPASSHPPPSNHGPKTGKTGI